MTTNKSDQKASMNDIKKLPTYTVKAEAGLHTLYRDDAMMQTPRALPLAVPHAKLAMALLHECLAQKQEKLDLRTMPMTQMALTVIDIVSAQRTNVIDGIMRYGDTELICQRVHEPEDLAAHQDSIWQPYVDWCATVTGAVLRMGHGIVPFEQDAQALAKLRAVVEGFDDYRLIGLSEAVGVSGSLVLGLALAMKWRDAKAVAQAAELDALWQMRKWGEDPAKVARHEDIERELTDCVQWLSLVGS